MHRQGWGVGGQNAGFRGHAEEAAHALQALLVEHVMDVLREVGADGALRDGQARGPLGGQGVDVLEAVIAGADKVPGDALLQSLPPAGAAPQTAEMKGRPVIVRHSWARSW